MPPHPRREKYVDERYLQWIRDQASIVSQSPAPSDPHHVWGSGAKEKRNDYMAVPLTRFEHQLYHSIGHKSFEERFNLKFEEEIIRLLIRYLRETWIQSSKSG